MNVTYCRSARVKRTNVPPGRFKGRGRQSNNDVTIATPEKSRLPSSHTHRQPSGQRAGGRERWVERPHHLPGTLFSKQLPSVPESTCLGTVQPVSRLAHQLNLASAQSQKTGTPRGGYTTVSGERAPSPGSPAGKTQAEVKESQEYRVSRVGQTRITTTSCNGQQTA